MVGDNVDNEYVGATCAVVKEQAEADDDTTLTQRAGLALGTGLQETSGLVDNEYGAGEHLFSPSLPLPLPPSLPPPLPPSLLPSLPPSFFLSLPPSSSLMCMSLTNATMCHQPCANYYPQPCTTTSTTTIALAAIKMN